MLHVRKYSPFVALAFGFFFTVAWIAAITWFLLYLVTSTILQMLSLTVTEITRIPAALPLFATGLGALGLLLWRSKRKAAAARATWSKYTWSDFGEAAARRLFCFAWRVEPKLLFAAGRGGATATNRAVSIFPVRPAIRVPGDEVG
jgi:hypothetical protein